MSKRKHGSRATQSQQRIQECSVCKSNHDTLSKAKVFGKIMMVCRTCEKDFGAKP